MQDKKQNVKLFLVCAVCIVLGVVFLIMGINMNNENKHLKRVCTGEVQGTVVDFYVDGDYYEEDDVDEDGKKTGQKVVVDTRRYYPVFEYEVTNKTYSKQSEYGYDRKRFAVDETVEIKYNPDNPDDYYVPADLLAAKTGGFNIGFGIFMIAFPVVMLKIKSVRDKKN